MTDRCFVWRTGAGLMLVAGLFCSPVPAATTVTVRVTVIEAPPCVINNNQTIEVNFGDVMTHRVDGTHYEQPLNYTLICTGNVSNALKMQIVGTQAGGGFGDNVLQTSAPGLGIALMKGGSAMTLNTWSNFTYPTLPVLTAVPVKSAGVTLSGGDFTASGTMRVEYQ